VSFHRDDVLWVLPFSGYRRRGIDPVRARVTHVSQLWLTFIEVTDDPKPRHWRMRIDTQREDTGTAFTARFMTDEQMTQYQRERSADALLHARGVRLDVTKWSKAQRVQLAEFIAHQLAAN
jgi:hypothetical protein